jgi:hypothetical protein
VSIAIDPRCGLEMTRYEVAGREASPGMGAWCGRPENHPGRCRTRESLRRAAQNALKQRTIRYRAARDAGLSSADAKLAAKSGRRFTQVLAELAA